MRTKTIYFFSLFLTITMMTGCFHISSGPKPSKSKMTKKYSVTPFNKIENKAPANIVFTQGNVTKVEADGPDNYIPQLIVMVKDSTLSISMDKDKFKNFKSSKINISITSPVLCNIKQRGVGSIYLKDSVKVTDLSISAEGVGINGTLHQSIPRRSRQYQFKGTGRSCDILFGRSRQPESKRHDCF